MTNRAQRATGRQPEASLGDRLEWARRRRFVGRSAERDIFLSLIESPEPAFQVLFIHGPGGIGKSTLLREFERLCHERDMRSVLVDGRNVEPAPDAILAATRLWDSRPRLSGQAGAPALHAPRVLLIDTYEQLADIDAWFREVFLPGLPEGTVVVLAGRLPPAGPWRADPGWQELLRAIPLRNLSPDESRDYLAQRSVPVNRHRRLLEFTHGHPLALSLVADAIQQAPDVEFDPEASPDVVKLLLERFIDRAPGPEHRAALEACGMVRVTTEALLSHALQRSDVHDLFQWLRGLSFIEQGPQGLFPHDLARAALVADVRWRNPDWYAEVHRRARGYYTAGLAHTSGRQAEQVLMDLIYLHRDNPVVRPFFAHLSDQASQALTTDGLKGEDLPVLLEMVQRQEGPESAACAEHWFKEQPDSVMVFRGSGGTPEGFCLLLALDRLDEAGANADPGVGAAWSYLHTHAPLRPGERATHFRYWMARATYQGISPVQNLIFVNALKHYLTAPRLAFSFFPCAAPPFWTPIFGYAELHRLEEADFTQDGKTYGVFGHDWRVVPPTAWLALLAERELAKPGPVATAPIPAQETVVVLSREEFATAIRDAMKGLTRPGLLSGNPLLRSRRLLPSAEAQRAGALQELLRGAAEVLHRVPRTDKFYQAVYHTYLHPAPSQEAAAELLDLPFSTFRRHLASGLAHVTETLWQRELSGEP